MSSGAAAGIGIGCAVAGILIGALVMGLLARRKTENFEQYETNPDGAFAYTDMSK